MTTPEIPPETAPSPPPNRPRRRLANVRNVRAGLADVIRGLEAGAATAGPLDPKRANALTYAYSTLAAIIQGADVEARIASLEALASKGGRL